MNSKLISILVIGFLGFNSVFAQKMEKNNFLRWHHHSVENDSVFGASIDKAYNALRYKRVKKEITIAIIGNTIDYNHQDLVNSVWTNEKEIPDNGKDDDNNGYIDDVHGWNFLGDKKGYILEYAPTSAERAFFRVKDKFKGKKKGDLVGKELDDFNFFSEKLCVKSEVGRKYQSIQFTKVMAAYVEDFNRDLKAKFPEKENYTLDDFGKIRPSDDAAFKKKQSYSFIMMGWSFADQGKNRAKWDFIYDNYRSKLIATTVQEYKSVYKKIDFCAREAVGDNYSDINDRYYGNNIVDGGNASDGNAVAGIIAATRNNNIGMDGIVNDVKIMPIRAIIEGDGYDKDISLAIRYAVDNGAQIIDLSFSKCFADNSKWVEDALKFAKDKGVLVVRNAGYVNNAIDKVEDYPSKYINGVELDNFIYVGSSDKKGNIPTYTAYGVKVDLFAPGVGLYTTVSNNNYKKIENSSMPSAVVTGVAALIWQHFPNLTAVDIKDILIKSVTPRNGVKVRIPCEKPQRKKPEYMDFSEACLSGGIVNAYKAVKLASQYNK